MNAEHIFESIRADRNRAGQGVQRDLTDADIPAEILTLLQQTNGAGKK